MNVKETLAEIKRVGLLRAGNLQDQLNEMALSLESEAIELRGQVSALQTSHDNIINSLGIKGDGPYSKLVIEYVLGLVAENAALKKSIPSPIEVELDNDSMDDVSIAEDVGFNHAISAFWKNIPTTPSTDAFTAELRAQGVDEFAASEDAKVEKWLCGDEYASYASKMAEEFVANLRAGRKG